MPSPLINAQIHTHPYTHTHTHPLTHKHSESHKPTHTYTHGYEWVPVLIGQRFPGLSESSATRTHTHTHPSTNRHLFISLSHILLPPPASSPLLLLLLRWALNSAAPDPRSPRVPYPGEHGRPWFGFHRPRCPLASFPWSPPQRGLISEKQDVLTCEGNSQLN